MTATQTVSAAAAVHFRKRATAILAAADQAGADGNKGVEWRLRAKYDRAVRLVKYLRTRAAR